MDKRMKPKISIIMGVYNGEKTLKACLDSIINQTFKSWEFIISDDKSIDNSLNILKEYAALDSRFIILENEKNVGLAATLNKCIKIARSDILARQDADDTSDPRRFQLQYDFYMANDISILGTYSHLVENGKKWGTHTPPLKPTLKNWLKGSQVIHASAFMNKKDIDALGGYDAEALRVEDLELWYRVLEQDKRIETMPEYLYNIEWSLNDYKRKKFSNRISEIKYMALSFSRLKLPVWKYLYLIKPLIAAFTPKFIMFAYHQLRFKK
jgi:glycosyltransferase EpsE